MNMHVVLWLIPRPVEEFY